MNNIDIKKTCMCSLCNKLYFAKDDITNCCLECQKKLIILYRNIINEYHKKNPDATVMDILKSDILTVPKQYKISATEFKKIVLASCNSIKYEDNLSTQNRFGVNNYRPKQRTR